MKKLGLLVFILLFVGVVTPASVGEVHIRDNAGDSDYVTYFLDNSTNESSITPQVNSSGLDVSLDSVERDENITEIKYSLSIGESTGLFSGKLSAEQLNSLNISEANNFTVFYPSQATVEGPVVKTGADFVNDKYSIESFDEDIKYKIGKTPLLISIGFIGSFIFLPFFVFRKYAERVHNGSGDKEEKIYKLNRVMSLGSFPLMILLVPAMFELGFISIGDMLIASLLPNIVGASLAAVMLVVMVPVVGSMASMFIGIYPSIKKLRDLDASKKSSVKKFLAGLGLVFAPIMVWQFFVFNISSDLTSNLLFMVVAFGVFLISIMAVSPYLIMIFQTTRSLEGSIRENLEAFCNENG